MNKNTRANRKAGRIGINNGASHASVPLDIVKGRHVNSSKEREVTGKKPWQGAFKQPPKSLSAALEE